MDWTMLFICTIDPALHLSYTGRLQDFANRKITQGADNER